MKYILLFLLAFSFNVLADVYVQGYYRDNGTYVAPHYRSSPNSSQFDNWSSQGNQNPYTGQKGYKNPYNQYNNPYRNPYGGYPKGHYGN